MNQPEQSRIFISYSHRGNGPKWKAALVEALRVFEQHHLLDVWEDGKIRLSSFWDDNISQAMASARVAVVLLTPESLDSEYILSKELPALRDRQQREGLPVFPVICEDCNWRAHDWLRATQAPNQSNALAQLSAAVQERVFQHLATNIAEELSRVALEDLPAADPSSSSARIDLDKFPLLRNFGLREDKLIGREQELALLDLAFAQPRTAIVSLVAWGGVGKSMLVQHWLQRLERAGWFGARRIFAWSFFSQGAAEDRQASEDMFLAHALEWFGVNYDPAISPWDKGRLLAEAVASQRTLLILDGIEPLQHPPGPMGGQLRAPGLQSLLRQLARNANHDQHQGLCLVTTREPLSDLADFQRRTDAAWGSVLRIDLGNLAPEAGAVLLHHAGANRASAVEIKSNDPELLAASHEVDGHALTLNLLGRFLARAHGGDIRHRKLVQFEEADREEQDGTTFKMLTAFEAWFDKSGEFGSRQLAVLGMLSLLDRPSDALCVGELRKPPAVEGLTAPFFQTAPIFLGFGKKYLPLVDEDWNTAVSFLCDFGLVANITDKVSQSQMLDCHPLIREFFSSQLLRKSLGGYRLANHRLYQLLSAQVPQETEPSLDQLEILYQALAFRCRSGEGGEKCLEFYGQRILQSNRHYSLRQFGAFGADLVALSNFFARPWTQPAFKMAPGADSFLYNEVGTRLRALGRLSEAIDPLTASLKIDLVHKQWRSAALSCCNLSDTHMALGDLGDATSLAKWAVDYANRCDVDRYIHSYRNSNAFVMVTCSFPRHAYTHFQRGDSRTAEEMFHGSEVSQGRFQPAYPLLYSDVGFMYCDLRLSPAEIAIWKCILAGQSLPSAKPTDSTPVSPLAVVDDYELRRLPETPLECCQNVAARTARMIYWRESDDGLLVRALDHLTETRVELYAAILETRSLHSALTLIERAVDFLRRAAMMDVIPQGLLTRAIIRSLGGVLVQREVDESVGWR